MVGDVDVSPSDLGPECPRARPHGQEERARGLMSLYTPLVAQGAGAKAKGQAWVTKPMLVTLALLASFPLWAEHVGLYQYLGVEVAIWMVYALGYNLLLGYTGLPAFGQGAFFGIGAYAYGLCSLNWSHNALIALTCGVLAAAAAAGLVG